MNLKYVKNQTSESAELFLYGGVGDGINGDMVASEIRFLDSQGIKTIDIHINSGGGSIISGGSIIAAMIGAKAHINTFNDFIAASMGAMILNAGDTRHASEFSNTMIHEPSIGWETIDETKDKKVKGALIALRDQLSAMLVAKTGKTKEEIDELMNVETWMNAKQAKKECFVDVIVKSNSKKVTNVFDVEKMVAEFTALNINEKENNMEKIINHFNIDIEEGKDSEQAVIDHVENTVTDLNNELNAEKNKVKDLEAKVEITEEQEKVLADLEDVKNALDQEKENIAKIEQERDDFKSQLDELAKESDEVKLKLAENAVDSAIGSGKLHKDSRDEMIILAKDNAEAFNFMVKNINTPVVKITDAIQSAIGDDTRNDWTIRDWEKKDSKGLQKIKNENPSLYDAMWNKFYKPQN